MLSWVGSIGFVLERYVVIDTVVSAQARATFIVTDGTAPTPGLPNTGGGASRRGPFPWSMVTLSLVLPFLAAVVRRRRNPPS